MGAFFARNWKLKPPVPIADPGLKDPKKPGTTASRQPQWTLLLDSGENLPLTAEKKIKVNRRLMDANYTRFETTVNYVVTLPFV